MQASRNKCIFCDEELTDPENLQHLPLLRDKKHWDLRFLVVRQITGPYNARLDQLTTDSFNKLAEASTLLKPMVVKGKVMTADNSTMTQMQTWFRKAAADPEEWVLNYQNSIECTLGEVSDSEEADDGSDSEEDTPSRSASRPRADSAAEAVETHRNANSQQRRPFRGGALSSRLTSPPPAPRTVPRRPAEPVRVVQPVVSMRSDEEIVRKAWKEHQEVCPLSYGSST